jgi:hypothetical protein
VVSGYTILNQLFHPAVNHSATLFVTSVTVFVAAVTAGEYEAVLLRPSGPAWTIQGKTGDAMPSSPGKDSPGPAYLLPPPGGW